MSTKAEKKQRREAKKQQARRRQQIQSWVVKAAIVILVPLALYVFYDGLFGGAPVLPPDAVAETDHVRGNPDAALTITLYADYQCPSCAVEAAIIASAWPRISDDVRLVFRNFPLDTYAHSFTAARYAEAAAIQGQFWDMHDLLFADQMSWSGLTNPVPLFEGYAEQLGLDMEQLRDELRANPIRQKIIADQQGGIRAGVRGTPALFFNGEMVTTPRSAGQLITMVNAALENQ